MAVALSILCQERGAGFGVGIDLLIAERVDLISPLGSRGELPFENGNKEGL
jgi:hypothetical protein